MTDNIYANRNLQVEIQTELCVVEYAEKYGKREAFLYNNRLFFGRTTTNEKEFNKKQYDVNWKYINTL